MCRVLVMDCCSYVIPLWKIQPICIISFSKDFTKLPEPEKSLQQQQVSIVQGCSDSILQDCKWSQYCSTPTLLTHGSPTWRSIGEEHPVQLNPRQSHVLVDGRLHWLSLRGRYQVVRKLVSFDLADEPFREIPQPAGCDKFFRHQSHLVNIGGCLSAVVYHGCLRLEIWIMKEYGAKKSWTKEFNIGS